MSAGNGTNGNGNGGAPLVKLTRKDFVSDQDVRWCPGCGDYAILAQVQKVMPELNLGQLVQLVRAKYLIDAIGLNKIQGKPFKVSEIVDKIRELAGANGLRAMEVQA